MRLVWVLLVGSSVCLAGCMTPSSPRPAPTTTATAAGATPATVIISAEQEEWLRAYIGAGDSSAGRGRGRGRGRAAGGLPPGIAKNLQRGKPLPPGIAKQSLPGDVLRRLPEAPSGLEYVIAGGKLLLVEAATQVIREVLIDAVT